MYCTNCGAQVQDNALFCESCGSALAPQRASAAPNGFQLRETPIDTGYAGTYAAPQGEPYGYAAPGAGACAGAGVVGSQGTPCGYAQGVQDAYAQQYVAAQSAYNPNIESTDKTLRLIAFVLNLLVTIGFGICIIPLAWMVPMTVISWRIYKGERANTVAFGVCSLIFVSTIAGILLLCSKKDA